VQINEVMVLLSHALPRPVYSSTFVLSQREQLKWRPYIISQAPSKLIRRKWDVIMLILLQTFT